MQKMNKIRWSGRHGGLARSTSFLVLLNLLVHLPFVHLLPIDVYNGFPAVVQWRNFSREFHGNFFLKRRSKNFRREDHRQRVCLVYFPLLYARFFSYLLLMFFSSFLPFFRLSNRLRSTSGGLQDNQSKSIDFRKPQISLMTAEFSSSLASFARFRCRQRMTPFCTV